MHPWTGSGAPNEHSARGGSWFCVRSLRYAAVAVASCIITATLYVTCCLISHQQVMTTCNQMTVLSGPLNVCPEACTFVLVRLP